MKEIILVLQEKIEEAFEACGYNKKYGRVINSNRPDLCEFQCDGALMAAKEYKKAPFLIADEVVGKCKNCEEFEKIYLPFYNNVNDYLNKYVIPDLVTFYLANGYSRHCLSECNLINHINSAVDIFNCRCDINKLIPKIKEILKIKYNLVIVKNNPMILKKYY